MNEQYRANKNCPSDQEAHEGAKGKASEACPTRKYSRSDGEIRALTVFRKKEIKDTIPYNLPNTPTLPSDNLSSFYPLIVMPITYQYTVYISSF